MFSAIGLQEIIFTGVVVLILFGPRGASGIMRELGKFFGTLKKHRDEFSSELMSITDEAAIEPGIDREDTTAKEDRAERHKNSVKRHEKPA